MNPTAGRGAARAVRREVEAALAHREADFTVVETHGPGEAADLAGAAARAGASIVAAVGGDGTVHEVANGLLRIPPGAPAPALGVVPVGTGNDFVKVVAGIRARADAYDALTHGPARALDVGLVRWEGGEEFFVNAMGTGIDVEVVRQIRRIRNLPGAAVYVLGLAKALVRFRPIAVRVAIDGVELHARTMMVAVANGTCIGGAFRIAPGALPDDGLLDVVLVDEVGLAGALRVAPRILRGTHLADRAVRHAAARAVEIEVPQGASLFFQLDGELREPDVRRVHIEVRPGALQVVVSPRAAVPTAAAVKSDGEVL